MSIFRNARRAPSNLMYYQPRYFGALRKIFVGLLMDCYLALSITLSGMGMAQNITENPTKPKGLSEGQVISASKNEPIESFRISSSFGLRVDPMTGNWAMHQGVDIAGKRGSPILAPAKGQVCKASYQANLGNLIEIDHGNGYVSRYGHLDSFAVKEGDWVLQGQQIARLGSTGRASGPHLHYELRHGGKLVNPSIYPIKVFEDNGQGITFNVMPCSESKVDRKVKN